MSAEAWSLDAVLRGRALLVTQDALQSCSDYRLREQIAKLDVEQFEVAARDLAVNWQTIEHLFTHGRELGASDADTYLTDLLTAARTPVHKDTPRFVTLCDAQMAMLGAAGERVEEDLSSVRESFARATALLASGFPEGAERVRNSVRFVMGLRGHSGELRGFSSWRLPGFVAIGTNVPTLLVAEQLVHEATHVALECLLANDESTRAWIDAQPSLPSPFTASVRPARLVLHGWLSYGMVLALWERASNMSPTQCGFGSNEEHVAVVTRRRTMLIGRIADARALLDAFVDDLGCLHAVAESLCKTVLNILGAPIQGGTLPDLGRHERAELTLALADAKVSRIALDTRSGFELARAVRPSGHTCFSRNTLRLEHQSQLGGFSNLGANTKGWDEDASIYGYVASNPARARAAAMADELDEAGKDFGIPTCCRLWFERAWPLAVAHHHGDVVALLLSGTAEYVIDVAADAPPPALYFESGLHFHFPCSAFCAATIELVKTRRDVLMRLEPALLAELTRRLARPYLWVRGRAYVRLDGEAPETWDVRGDESVRTELAAHHVCTSDLMLGGADRLFSSLFRTDWRLLRPL